MRIVRHGQMLDDAPWAWGQTGGWRFGFRNVDFLDLVFYQDDLTE